MINLLPEEYKKEIRAARMNVVLLRYNFITLAGLAILLLACVVFYYALTGAKNAAQANDVQNASKVNSYASTKALASEYDQNLATAKKILANQVNYTDLVLGIAALMPKGTVLDGINLSANDFGNTTVLSARSKDYDAATKLKNNFQKSDLFEDVHFQSLTDAADANAGNYPITITISVKIINKVKK